MNTAGFISPHPIAPTQEMLDLALDIAQLPGHPFLARAIRRGKHGRTTYQDANALAWVARLDTPGGDRWVLDLSHLGTGGFLYTALGSCASLIGVISDPTFASTQESRVFFMTAPGGTPEAGNREHFKTLAHACARLIQLLRHFPVAPLTGLTFRPRPPEMTTDAAEVSP